MDSMVQRFAGRAGQGWVGLLLAVSLAGGCSPKRAVQVFPPASSRDAIQQARDMLSLYADGQPVGSESIGFDTMVANVRAIDPENAAILERGFAQITARPATARAVAGRLLVELPASAATQAPGP